MKKNGACRVHSDLCYLGLSQLKPGQCVTVTQDLHSMSPGELRETFLSRPCRVGAHFSMFQIILLCSWLGTWRQSYWLLAFILGNLSWLWEQRRRNLLMVKMLSWERETEMWTRKLLFSLFLNTKVQNKIISLLPLFFFPTCRLDTFPYCSAWTGDIMPLPMTSLVLVASFWEEDEMGGFKMLISHFLDECFSH